MVAAWNLALEDVETTNSEPCSVTARAAWQNRRQVKAGIAVQAYHGLERKLQLQGYGFRDVGFSVCHILV